MLSIKFSPFFPRLIMNTARPIKMLREISRENSLQASKIVFVLLLCASLFVHGYSMYNFLFPLCAVLLAALNLERFKETLRYHRQALFFLSLLYVWMWVSALLSDFQSIAIIYSVKYSIHFIVLVIFFTLTYKKKSRFLIIGAYFAFC